LTGFEISVQFRYFKRREKNKVNTWVDGRDGRKSDTEAYNRTDVNVSRQEHVRMVLSRGLGIGERGIYVLRTRDGGIAI
jgi:hypothetical protein